MNKNNQKAGQFSDLGIATKILTILTKNGFNSPMPIQNQIIPAAIKGKDVVGVAQTGTGKTLAFGIPMIQRIALDKGQGLVVVPTRELALQVEKSLKQIGGPIGLRTTVIIGGVSQRPQVKSLRQNPHIVIATPGRLADLMDQKLYSLKNTSVITLDEADRMLDVGFLPQIKQILKSAPKERQTMLFSATMPKSISSLASEFMKIPLRIEIAPQGTLPENVVQEIFVIRKNDKMRLLDSLLEQYKEDTVLIFSRTKHGAKRIARDIRYIGHTATEIHSNRSQKQRELALNGFAKRKYRVLVATDIAARGIDVKHISLVINFDLPDNSEDYVHRIGRTGRVGRYGKAISFVTPSQKADVKKIERLIRKSLPVLALPTLSPERPKPPQEKQSHRSNRSHFNSRNKSRRGSGGNSGRSGDNSSGEKRKRSGATRRSAGRRSGASRRSGGGRSGGRNRSGTSRRSRS